MMLEEKLRTSDSHDINIFENEKFVLVFALFIHIYSDDIQMIYNDFTSTNTLIPQVNGLDTVFGPSHSAFKLKQCF